MNESTQGMKVVIQTYAPNGELQGESSFYVDDDVDIINQMDSVENHLFNQYEQYIEGDQHE